MKQQKKHTNRLQGVSGILLHPTSLPSPYGIGDLGDEAYRFADFLEKAGQHLWQILPLNLQDLEIPLIRVSPHLQVSLY